MNLDRSKMLVLAGGGGGGGGGGTFGSGGNAGNAGANADFSGQAGSDAYHLDSDCDYGRGGGGGIRDGPGTYGSGGCFSSDNGSAGNGFYGGAASLNVFSPTAGQGAPAAVAGTVAGVEVPPGGASAAGAAARVPAT